MKCSSRGYPVPPSHGRLGGILVMTVGGSAFAILAGYIAHKLQVTRELEEEEHLSLTYSRAVVPLAELKQYPGEQEKTDIRILTRLEQLERLMDGENKPPDSKPSA